MTTPQRLELTGIVIGAVCLAIWGGCQLYSESKLHAPKTHTPVIQGTTPDDADAGVTET